MKRLFFVLIFVFAGLSVKATGQMADYVFVDGEEWYLLGRPIGADTMLYFGVRASFQGAYCESTGNWDGFVAYWSIMDGLIILDSIKFLNANKNCEFDKLPDSVLQKVFKKYYVKGRIVAGWVNGTLRLAKGNMIYYFHGGFLRNYETEMHITVERGRVVETKLFNNRVAEDGFAFEDLQQEYWDSLSFSFRHFANSYRELDSVNRFYVEIDDIDIDSTGHLNDVPKVKVHLVQGNRERVPETVIEQLEQEFKKMLMAIPKWKVYCINGKYGTPYHGWNMPIRLKINNE